ncbi:MAG TPA: MdtA/MuxA family multidrug efflux RND transporter periplasmic adaptor subunit [Rhodocyclaceae bacterium]|nr:MdtA/MuxA family multidrug efflux RND transporter periplasmic adaptor subunit [Rhodocyclaceae bacterium]
MGIREHLVRNRRTVIAALVAAGLAAGGGSYFFFTGQSAEANIDSAAGKGRRDRPGGPGGPGRVQPIQAAEAKVGDLDVALGALGTVTASNTATVKPRVDGQLVKVHFREGQTVKAGDLLAEIDPRPFQVQLDQVKGQLTKDRALLAAAQVDLERYKKLLAQDSIARQQVDAQEALVRQYQGTVEADQAQEANARLQLGFTRVTAPAAGRLGLRQVDAGNIVRSADTNGLVVITQTRPIHVVFAIPADSLGDVASRLQKGENLAVEAWNRDGKTLLGQGRLISADNQVDLATGTVKLKAEFANPDDSLFPNQFVNAKLKVETRRGVVLLPAAAIQRNPQGAFVYAINKEEQTVEPRPLTLGPASGEQVVVDKGLAAGEQVVLEGADRLRPGAKVEVLSVDGKARGEGGPAGGEGKKRRRGSDEQKSAAAPR